MAEDYSKNVSEIDLLKSLFYLCRTLIFKHESLKNFENFPFIFLKFEMKNHLIF